MCSHSRPWMLIFLTVPTGDQYMLFLWIGPGAIQIYISLNQQTAVYHGVHEKELMMIPLEMGATNSIHGSL